MNTKRFVTIFILVLGLLLILSVGLSAAQEAQDESPPLEPASVNFGEQEYKIPIQGRLTDASGVPENGDFNVTFSVYDDDTGSTLLCDDTHLVSVSDGLFNTVIEGCTTGEINGQQLYLGIKVGDDDEMDPLQPLYPVPYAYSLVPGAMMRGNILSWSMLRVFNEGDTNSTALAGIAESTTGTNTGVLGWSNSADGVGGRFRNDNGGVALAATGSGIFRSSAPTYLFIPGSAIVSNTRSASTNIQIYDGATRIWHGGGGTGTRWVSLPITIPGVLYGQRVRITEVRIYYDCSDANSYINHTYLFRQTGATTKNYLINDNTIRDSTTPTYYAPPFFTTADTTLSADSGSLSLQLMLHFTNSGHHIQIGMVRLTLEHH